MLNPHPIFNPDFLSPLMEDAMKKAMLNLCLASGVLMLGGCANWPSTPGYVEVVDQQKIDLIERWARTNNTQVIWITTPMRKVPVATGT
jgi:hypothetical protein